MVPQQAEFAGMCAALGRTDIPQDPRFASTPARYRHAKELRALLEPLMAQFDNATLEAAFRQHGAPLGRVNEKPAVLTDPQVQHNQALVELAHGDVGRVRVARSAARFDGHAQVPTRGAARLGEHGEVVMAELGFSATQIAELVAQGVLRIPPDPAA